MNKEKRDWLTRQSQEDIENLLSPSQDSCSLSAGLLGQEDQNNYLIGLAEISVEPPDNLFLNDQREDSLEDFQRELISEPHRYIPSEKNPKIPKKRMKKSKTLNQEIQRRIQTCFFINYMRNKLEEFGMKNKFQCKQLNKEFRNTNYKKSKSYLILYFVLLQEKNLGAKFIEWFTQNYQGKKSLWELIPLQKIYFYEYFDAKIQHIIPIFSDYCLMSNVSELVKKSYKADQVKGSKGQGKVHIEITKCQKKINQYLTREIQKSF